MFAAIGVGNWSRKDGGELACPISRAGYGVPKLTITKWYDLCGVNTLPVDISTRIMSRIIGNGQRGKVVP